MGATASRSNAPPASHARAAPIDLRAMLNADDEALADRFDPSYRSAFATARDGELVSRGLPFRIGGGDGGRRWLLVDRPVTVPLGGVAATHLVLLAFCDAHRDATGRRPDGMPVGWVLPVGEPLARATLSFGGTSRAIVLRRRFEVNEGIGGWGSPAFLALPHLVDVPVDWRGPHPRQAPGRPAAAGQTGPLSVLPGSWGFDQTGIASVTPGATGGLLLWLHAIAVDPGSDQAGAAPPPRRLDSISFEPIEGAARGRDVVIAAMTAFSGTGSPLRWLPRRSIRLSGAGAGADGLAPQVGLDLGTIVRRRPLAPPPRDPIAPPTGDEIVDLTAAADATLAVGGAHVRLAALVEGSPRRMGRTVVEALGPLDRRVAVSVVDAAGAPVPARVRFVSRDGRYLPPLGHADEVNPGFLEDHGADLVLGAATYAYVDGRFEIDLPADGAVAEVVHGFDVPPQIVDISHPGAPLTVAFPPALAPSGGTWVTADTHVHFLSPATASLQARAEGVDVVHLLAAQWGDLHTSVADLGGDIVDPGGRRAIWIGTENRQAMLGHVGLVGAARPTLPLSSGGSPEDRLGGGLTELVADWLTRARGAGGLAIAAHFPLPMAELPADLAAGLLDALEFDCLEPALASPPILQWYRYLDAGFRIPIVGGTDRMTAGVPLGQIRTWVRLDDESLTFDRWAAAIRAGRTVVTSGPILELKVEGREPGDSLAVDPGSHVQVEVTARAASPIIGALELVQDGQVVSRAEGAGPASELVIRDRLVLERTGWIAARTTSAAVIPSAFPTAMAAHTSAIYVDVRGRPRSPVDLSGPLALLDGVGEWLRELAPGEDRSVLERRLAFLADARRRFRDGP